MKERSVRAMKAAIIAGMQPKYELVYVDRGDRLTDEQVGFLVANDFDKLWDDLAEFETTSRDAGVDAILPDLIDEVLRGWSGEDDVDYEHLRVAFANSEEFEDVRQEMEGRDESDWVRALARGAGDVLLRIACIGGDEGWSSEPVTPQQVLEQVGFEASEHNVSAVQGALDECSPEFSVLLGFWFFGADVEALYDLDGSAPVKITDPYLYLGNPFAGSGYITTEPLQGAVTVQRDELRTDEGAFGYSLNKVFGGLSASQFAAKIESVKDSEEEQN